MSDGDSCVLIVLGPRHSRDAWKGFFLALAFIIAQ